MTWSKRFYAAALFCGLAPLAIATAIILVWCAVDWDWLTRAGIYTILGGVAAALVGLLLTVAYVIASLGRAPKRQIALRTLLALVVLLLNFPAAYLMAKTAAYVPPARAKIYIGNDGPDLDGFTITGASLKTSFAPIKSGDWSQRKFSLKRDGKLEFNATQGGQPISGVLLEYVTPSDQPNLELIFDPDGSWAVEVLRAR